MQNKRLFRLTSEYSPLGTSGFHVKNNSIINKMSVATIVRVLISSVINPFTNAV